MEKCSYCNNNFISLAASSSPIPLKWCMDLSGEWWMYGAGELECPGCRREKISAGTWKLPTNEETKR